MLNGPRPARRKSGSGGRLPAVAPLPPRQGVAASRVYLPDGPWLTMGEYLSQRFPHVPADILAERLARGDIVDETGVAQHAGAAYRPRIWLWYYREAPREPAVPFDLPVLFRDERLLVVDKPHFLASIPGGRHLHETALTRLRLQFDLPLLAPVHRLDRDTAGVLVFCLDPQARGAYQSLFQARAVYKEYEAIAALNQGLALPCVYQSRIDTAPGAFVVTSRLSEMPNSETRIELMETLGGGLGLYRLLPLTGRKHQLRAHMSALDMPIVNDRLYPVLKTYLRDDDFSRPLQLLARRVAFKDPFTGAQRVFESARQLQR
ncbi:pseudouridine synthase [Allopusillimonas ginsengisoli]|uniref:pseudouridine synthase n=1 Tax=Allopusillimonas ginsengisoli TaxID=453575 RepID=UPI001021FB84|nr:pseudouridine synthase [Allopusillimonas ginsengisoli]TEA77115.1 pseudouridine synthase [Allopusillimonas ginsengisoli]